MGRVSSVSSQVPPCTPEMPSGYMYAASVVSCAWPLGSPGLHCSKSAAEPSDHTHCVSTARSLYPSQQSSTHKPWTASFSSLEWIEARCPPCETHAASAAAHGNGAE